MSMNHKTPSPAPRPLCALYTPRLALLVQNQLDANEAAEVRAHLAECEFCQLRLREYEMVWGALHRHIGVEPSSGQSHSAPAALGAPRDRAAHRSAPPLFTLEDIMRAANQQDRETASTPTSHQRPRLPEPSPRARMFTTFGAVAAVLVLTILAASLFTYFSSRSPGPAAGQISEFRLPTAESYPYGITRGPDGNLWFTEYVANRIGRITPHGAVTEYVIPTANSRPAGITSGPDGNLWFIEVNGGKIGRITPAGQISEFPAHGLYKDSPGITSGPDGNLWFTAGGAIGRITPSGRVTEFPLALPGGTPESITSGPDGTLWFTDASTLKIGRITPAGQISEFALPTVSGLSSCATDCLEITRGPDGNLWFTEEVIHKIGRITPTGQITEFPLPATSDPFGITRGPDGTLWFTEQNADKIGRITPRGTVTEYLVPGALSNPVSISITISITSGPDGALWFTEAGSNQIGRITP
jgi:streptogramin lyase